ncbi:enoyl-CoA hydratase/isomerase family protein [Marinobacter panjinensis]|uniref:3-hydroxyisobutyryl-CoA hydrolase n=1 Tax=Marinobacter panjinensis TaxID=2576384 RepID=A0A4U6R6L6_9GAMM|nr:enoyl-CoA hydratase/isomerase family protein [Marinobacter panjinensis]MCR8914539.1 enoyl-CoA hydratase/isomerase family protein [Marinobacter panjinensis]TKV68638.1 enoyl-CoA hydratase/isomerase family protein [Marinobacter panjinensis]
MPIQVQELECREGTIGQITLDAPGSLNALSGSMIDDIQTTLDQWAGASHICMVIFRGAGDRAFCAGGDIRELYGALSGMEDNAVAANYFAHEYRVDYTIHRYPKPVITIAHGAVMGGGMGILSASRYRVITPDIKMAMPEISIGLFPDVAASWFLNRLPGRLGLFMGLTGARLNATDALRVGLADMAILPEQIDSLIARLQDERWTGESAADDNRLFRLIKQLEHPDYRALPASELARHEQSIARLSAGDELPAIVENLLAADVDSDWWKACMDNLRGGCPVTAWLVWTQLKKAQQMSLKDIFRMELAMAIRCTQRPDLREGIRARLIEKDNSPQWSFKTVADVPESVVEEHFLPELDDSNDPMNLD